MNRKLCLQIFWLALATAITSCRKVPLSENFGGFNLGTIDWFPNEGVAYVFFSIKERPERLIQPSFELSWTAETKSGGEESQELSPLDVSTGVHEHALRSCGANLVCGSYSFRSDGPIRSARMRFLYDQSSTLSRSIELSISNHANNPADQLSYSALMFGVFDTTNEFLRVHAQHNFAFLPSRKVAAYGLTRKFRVSAPQLEDHGIDSLRELAVKSNGPELFPAGVCAAPATAAAGSIFSGTTHWLSEQLPASNGAATACFAAEYLDKDEQSLTNAAYKAIARRNPRLTSPSFTLQTPLQAATQIPIVVKICDDDPIAGSMEDADFYRYQRHILDLNDRPIDICFRFGQEQQFSDDFAAHLSTRLAAAKASATEDRDFVFVVLFHQLFSREFQQVHAAIAGRLTELGSTERNAISPRLVGSLVYTADTIFKPTALQSQHVIWCPQELLTPQGLPANSLFNQNCVTAQPFELDLRVINFVAPMGAFPSRQRYNEYVDKYGDAGLAKKPSVRFLSVPTGPSSLQESGQTVTFFDNQRYTIPQGEKVRVCFDRLGREAAHYRIRPATFGSDDPSLGIAEASVLWMESADADAEYRIGLAWDYPFIAQVQYEAAVIGNVGPVTFPVPFQRNRTTYERLGDAVWTTQSWRFGENLQHCSAYCDHPYFDEAGTYQIQGSWSSYNSASCPAPNAPTYPGAS